MHSASIRRVEVARDIVRVDFEPPGSMASSNGEEGGQQPKPIRLELPYKTVSSKGSIRIIPANTGNASFGPDASRIAALAKGYAWREQLLSGQAHHGELPQDHPVGLGGAAETLPVDRLATSIQRAPICPLSSTGKSWS